MSTQSPRSPQSGKSAVQPAAAQANTPQAMDVRVEGHKVPAFHIIAGQYPGLVVVSAFVAWLVSR